MEFTTPLAVWGAILSTSAIVWNILRDARDKGRLKIGGMIGKKHPDPSDRDYVVLDVTNVGRRPVMVKGWGGRYEPHTGERDAFLINSPELPRMLKEGEYVILIANDLKVVGDRTREILVWDSTGREWRLSKTILRRLRAEAKQTLGADAAGADVPRTTPDWCRSV